MNLSVCVCKYCAEALELRVVRYRYMVEKYLTIFGDVSFYRATIFGDVEFAIEYFVTIKTSFDTVIVRDIIGQCGRLSQLCWLLGAL